MYISSELMNLFGPQGKFSSELRRVIRNRRYEKTPEGVSVQNIGMFGGVGFISVNDGPVIYSANLVVNEGLDHALASWLLAGLQAPNWYIAPFTNDVTPDPLWTAANFASNAGEWQNYDETTRQVWTGASTGVGVVDNTASRAAFTANTAAATIYGLGILSDSTKGGVAGTLAASTRFATSKAVDPTDILNAGWSLTFTSS